MKKIASLAFVVVACGPGCAPRPDAPPGVRSLRSQRRRETIALPAWTLDVAEELADNADRYSRKTLVIARAYLDPRRPIRRDGNTVRFPLRGGGAVAVTAADVPAWLRGWTGAPLKLRASVHPPRRDVEGRVVEELLLRARAIDFAHPLELTHVAIDEERRLSVRVENFRGEPATATLEGRFCDLAFRQPLGVVAPGGVVEARALATLPADRPWQEVGPEARSLTLRFADGSRVSVDLAAWLRPPTEGLLDWGYRHSGTSTAVLALPRDVHAAELERFAALELRSFLHQFTDANIEPREPDDPEPLPRLPLLVVGTAAHSRLAATLIGEAGLAARIQSVGPEGYVLKSLTHGGRPTLLVTAQTARGLVSGVYSLLMRYGVRFSLSGSRLPARGGFRVLEVDEATAPLFARRRLVAVGSEAGWTRRWSQWDWLAMFDAAAKNRFNEVVVPLDGLAATFAWQRGTSRGAVFPFDIGPYACVAEAYVAHQRGLALVADVARRRGLTLTFARHDAEGRLRRAAPPACLRQEASGVGEALAVLRDAGDLLSLPRVGDTAAAVAAEADRAGAVLSVPYGRGARFRAGFLARFAWDRALTPSAFYASWASTVVEGEEAAQLARVLAAIDALGEDLLAVEHPPFGTGAPLVLPVEPDDLRCAWAALARRATDAKLAPRLETLRAQSQRLRAVQRQLDPIYAELHEALGGVTAPWEAAAFEEVSATRLAERITLRAYMLRSLLGALASVHEGTLAYYAGLAEPEDALARLHGALSKYRKARRILLWIAASGRWAALEPTLARMAERLNGQARLLAEWLGPAAEAETSVRLRAHGSEAIIHLFRTAERNVYAVHRLDGHETAHLRLNAAEARLVRRGQPPTTLRASGGAFLVAIDTVPTYIVTRRAAWPGQPME